MSGRKGESCTSTATLDTCSHPLSRGWPRRIAPASLLPFLPQIFCHLSGILTSEHKQIRAHHQHSMPALQNVVGVVGRYEGGRDVRCNVNNTGQDRYPREPRHPSLQPSDRPLVSLRSPVPRPVILRARNGLYGRHLCQRRDLAEHAGDDDEETPDHGSRAAVPKRKADVGGHGLPGRHVAEGEEVQLCEGEDTLRGLSTPIVTHSRPTDAPSRPLASALRRGCCHPDRPYPPSPSPSPSSRRHSWWAKRRLCVMKRAKGNGCRRTTAQGRSEEPCEAHVRCRGS